MNEKNLGTLPRILLGSAALCQAAAALAYTVVQPRGFVLVSLNFFEHQLLGPIVIVLAVILALAVVKRRDELTITVTSALAGFWFVAAGVGLFAGTTLYAHLLAVPFTLALVIFAFVIHRSRSRLVLEFASFLAGALLGAAFVTSVRAPQASTFPSPNRSKSISIPQTEPGLHNKNLRVFVQGALIVIEMGIHRAEIVPSFDYSSVADNCGPTILDYRSAGFSSYRAGSDGRKIVFAADSADFQTFGTVEIQGESEVIIDVSTVVRHEICAHLGSIVAISLSRLRGSAWTGGNGASVNGIPWPASGGGEPARFVAFHGDELGFYRATEDEKGPFTLLSKIDEPVITASGFRVRVPSWKAQASRAPSPTAGWGISQGSIEHYGDWFFWGIAATSIGRGWHTVRTAPGTYETRVVLEKL